ncbi:MAG: hypothetical protein RBQ94_01675 [Methanimicrococcus sp.]|nr:hypothetical protein [Methanimicrococcus sp.]
MPSGTQAERKTDAKRNASGTQNGCQAERKTNANEMQSVKSGRSV